MTVLSVHDPDALLRHRGIRTTIVMTAMFALGVLVLDNANLALFGAFGAFALLGFADFGGDPRPRTVAYLWLGLVGIVMIGLGTIVSEHVVVGAVALALIAFVIQLSNVLGGYFAAGGPAALLLFVVAVMVPAPPAEVVGREVGWLLACVLSIAVASVLWPVHQRVQIRTAAAEVADALAAFVRTAGGAESTTTEPARTDADAEAELARLHDRLDQLRDLYGRTGVRPAGPTQHDQALVRLIDQQQRSVSFAARMRARPPGDDGPSPSFDDPDLADAVAREIAHTAAVLRGTAAPELDTSLEVVREEHREALQAWVADGLRRGVEPAIIVARLRRTFPLRVVSHSVLSAAADAVLALGGTLPPDQDETLLQTPPAGGFATTIRRATALLAPHLRPSSVAFRNALRAAIALPVALLLADAVHAEHGFWVVLGTITVLKSSALRTGITALQALGGNVLGFAAAAAVLAAIGDNPAALWLVLPVSVFLSAYAPAAIHFVIGQASFTVLVVVLFNILEPEGWRTGLVRVESVALGAAAGLLIGIVFWPRGNRQALREATSAFYRSLADYVGATLATLTRPSTPSGSAAPGPLRPTDEQVASDRHAARSAELRADEALFDLLTTANVKAEVPAWTRLTSVGRSLRLVGDGITALSQRGLTPLLEDEDQRELDALGTRAVARVALVADRVDQTEARPGGPSSPAAPTGEADALPSVLDGSLDDPLVRWLAHVDGDDPDSVGRTLAMTWSLEWIEVIGALVDLDEQPTVAVAAEAGAPWWR